jgi:hypothetical protein
MTLTQAGYTFSLMDDASREQQHDHASSAPSAPAGGLTADNVGAKEQLGPLLVSRYRKADGRALILYTRVSTSAGKSRASSGAPPRP